jgi:hypothetical protein
MAYTIEDISLRDREFAKFPATVSGVGLVTSGVCMAVVLCGMVSGTTTLIPIKCNAEGMLLTSGA